MIFDCDTVVTVDQTDFVDTSDDEWGHDTDEQQGSSVAVKKCKKKRLPKFKSSKRETLQRTSLGMTAILGATMYRIARTYLTFSAAVLFSVC